MPSNRGIRKEFMLVLLIQPASTLHKALQHYTCNTMNTGPNRVLYANYLFILITPTSINRSIIHVNRQICFLRRRCSGGIEICPEYGYSGTET